MYRCRHCGLDRAVRHGEFYYDSFFFACTGDDCCSSGALDSSLDEQYFLLLTFSGFEDPHSSSYFHPLHQYHGPLLSRLIGLPVLYHAWEGDLHYHLYRLQCSYGTIGI